MVGNARGGERSEGECDGSGGNVFDVCVQYTPNVRGGGRSEGACEGRGEE